MYTKRLGFYFSANDIEDPGKKRSILLTVCGPSTYQLLKSLLQPASPADKTYDELVQTLNNHFSPVPSSIVQRFKFNTRIRKSGETVAIYVAELKALGEHCGFGDQLNDMVRDRLVCSINDNRIQRRLLQETDLTYKKALEIAQAMEVAARDINDLQKQFPHTATVQRLQTQKHKVLVCYRCGNNHLATSCRFQQAECRNCGKVGHIAKVCRSKIQKVSKKTTKGQATQYMLQDSHTLLTKPDHHHLLLHSNSAKMFMIFSQSKASPTQLF